MNLLPLIDLEPSTMNVGGIYSSDLNSGLFKALVLF